MLGLGIVGFQDDQTGRNIYQIWSGTYSCYIHCYGP